MKKRELQKLVAAYKLGKVLGEGGNGVVYAATDITSGERVALKLFQSAHLNRYARFKDEVKVMTHGLKDPTIRFRF